MAGGDWRPLSRRRGVRDEDGPHEGVPAHMAVALETWCRTILNEMGRGGAGVGPYVEIIALRLRIVLEQDYPVDALMRVVHHDDDLFLDVVDMLLHSIGGRPGHSPEVAKLKRLLGLSGSLWTVSTSGKELVVRVSEAEEQAYAAAVAPGDAASEELATAWSKLYGRAPDPSDAWDHAIKEVETVLSPIIAPEQAKPTLGSLLKRLGDRADTFDLRLPTSSTESSNVEALVQMLRLVWPNPDRHGSGTKRTPTPEEAVDVVHLAVTIVGWVRRGALTVRVDSGA